MYDINKLKFFAYKSSASNVYKPILPASTAVKQGIAIASNLTKLVTSLSLIFGFQSLVLAQTKQDSPPSTVGVQSVNTHTDLYQVLTYEFTEVGTPVVQSTGAHITLNVGVNADLKTAPGATNDDMRAIDITLEHTQESIDLGIEPQAIIHSHGKVQGIRVNTISDYIEYYPTPVAINIYNGKVYGDTFAIFVNQFRSSDKSPTSIYIGNAEVINTSTNYGSAAIFVFGNQDDENLVNIKIDQKGFLISKSGFAFISNTLANINNFGTIEGNIRIDYKGYILNNGNWLLGGNNFDENTSTVEQIINVGKIGLLPYQSASYVSLVGNVQNYNEISLSNGFAGDVLTINGNLFATDTSYITLDAQLDGDASAKDKLLITGNTSGESIVYINNIKGKGAGTVQGIKIIEVQGFSGAQFKLAKPVQAGNYEYFLRKINNDFYLISSLNNLAKETNLEVKKSPLVLRPAITGFMMANNINHESNLLLLGNSYQRLNAKNWAQKKSQSIWMHTGASEYKLTANAFAVHNPFLSSTLLTSQQTLSQLQMGTELWQNSLSSQHSQQALHALAGYGLTRASISNPGRAQANASTKTVDLNTTQKYLGLEYQYDFASNAYVNTLVSVGQIHNAFQDSYGGKAIQNGHSLHLSVEAGKALDMGTWTLEPQAQWVFQKIGLNAFKDEYSAVEAYSSSQHTLRLGARFSKKENTNPNTKLYAQIDVSQSFYQKQAKPKINYENYNASLDNEATIHLEAGAIYQKGASQIQLSGGIHQSLAGQAKTGAHLKLGLNFQF